MIWKVETTKRGHCGLISHALMHAHEIFLSNEVEGERVGDWIGETKEDDKEAFLMFRFASFILMVQG